LVSHGFQLEVCGCSVQVGKRMRNFVIPLNLAVMTILGLAASGLHYVDFRLK
jgi:hypothetical protein